MDTTTTQPVADFVLTPREARLLVDLSRSTDEWLRLDIAAFVTALDDGDTPCAYRIWWDHVVGNTVGEDYAVARQIERRLNAVAYAS